MNIFIVFQCVMRAKYRTILGAPVLKVSGRCPMHAILSAPLPFFWQFSTWIGHPHLMLARTLCHSLFGQVSAHACSTAEQACAGMLV